MIDTITQLYEEEEDNELFITDRTISLQYRQFRTPRKDIKQLMLDNKKTYLLSEAEIQKYLNGYINILSSNRNSRVLDSDRNSDISNFKEKICVDIEGFSIETGKKLGNNYLGNNCILVSTKQTECGSIRDSYLDKHIKKIFDNNRDTIEQVLIGEALIGKVSQKDINLMVYNPENLFNVEIVFDTPNDAISKLKNIRRDEKILSENEDRLKDRTFLKNILRNIEDVSEKHGSLDRIPDKEINLKERVDFNKLRLGDIDIYCLKSIDGTSVLVYFDDNDKESDIHDDIIILNGKDIESLNVLIELGMVGYNPYMGLERASNMILRNRKEKREERKEKREERREKREERREKREERREKREERREKRENASTMVKKKNRFDLDEDDNIPEKARELLEAVEQLTKNKRGKDFFDSLGNIKIYMTYPSIQNDILYELLTRMENNEYKSCYMDTEKFMSIASNMNDEQLGKFVEKILYSLEFSEENNTMVNMWLAENRKNVCNDLGIEITDAS